jgi:hypothetical protein
VTAVFQAVGGFGHYPALHSRQEPRAAVCECGHHATEHDMQPGPRNGATWTPANTIWPCELCSCMNYRLAQARRSARAL